LTLTPGPCTQPDAHAAKAGIKTDEKKRPAF